MKHRVKVDHLTARKYAGAVNAYFDSLIYVIPCSNSQCYIKFLNEPKPRVVNKVIAYLERKIKSTND